MAYFWHDDGIRSRCVSPVVHTRRLEVPAPSARLAADWETDTCLHVGVAPGDVEQLPLARTRARWTDFRRCVQAAADWTRMLGLPDGLLAGTDIALMTCRGARYHHDGAQYGGSAFLNLFLSEDKGLDLHFPQSGHRIPLSRGTAVVFDPGQPHAVIPRHRSGFDVADFPQALDCTQVFLTWELPIDNAQVAQALGIRFDVDPATAATLAEEQVRLKGAAIKVCPASGRLLTQN